MSCLKEKLKLSIVDANTKKKEQDESYAELVSVVSLWLKYEVERANLTLTTPACDADVVLLVHSGELDFRENCTKALIAAGIDPDPDKRRQYVITGGAVDASPMLALSIANALAVGEAYRFVRELFALINRMCDIEDLRSFIIEYPHAIERSQVACLELDPYAPYLFRHPPPTLATPDEWVDWGDLQPYLTDDGVYRVVASKGCHLRCQFCATTYRQTYRINPEVDSIVDTIRALKAQKARVALITNDAADLPYYDEIVRAGQLQFQSMTVKALRDKTKLAHVTSTRMKLVRFGVEGLSERIRQAFGKPVSNGELLEILRAMRENRQHVKLFYIVGAPFEDDYDYSEFRAFFDILQSQVDSQTVVLKFTAFNPQFPTPLAYFIPPSSYKRRFDEMLRYVRSRVRNNHVGFIPPRSPHRRNVALAETYNLTLSQVKELLPRADETVDLAPTLEHAQRMTCEIVAWHLSVERRWRLSRSYMKRMQAV